MIIKNYQKGFAPIKIILLVVVILIIVGGGYYLKNQSTLNQDGVIFQQNSTMIVGVTFPLKGSYFIMEVFKSPISLSSNKLMVVNTKNNSSELLNLSGFERDIKDSYDVDIFSPKSQQIFSPAGDKIILPIKEFGNSYPAYNFSVIADLAVFDLTTNSPGKIITDDQFKYKVPVSSSEFYYGWVSDHEIMYTCLPITGVPLEEKIPHYCYYNLDTGKTELKEKIDKFITYDTVYASDSGSQPPAFTSKFNECVLISANLGCLKMANGEILHQKNRVETSLYKGDFNSFFGWPRGDDVYVVINQATWESMSTEIKKFNLGN